MYLFLKIIRSTVAKRLARHFTFGRSRVLTPVPSDQVWVFSGFPTPSHRGMSHIVISQIRRMLGQYQPLSTYHLPSAPILAVPIPNLPVSVTQQSAPLSGGNERCILFSLKILNFSLTCFVILTKRKCPVVVSVLCRLIILLGSKLKLNEILD
jgi:hypothetical protein